MTDRLDFGGTRRSGLAGAAVLLMVALCSAQPAVADEPAAEVTGIPDQSIVRNFPQNGDADGRRKALAQRGITFGLNYVGEYQANIDGGIKRGDTYVGRLEGVLDVDLERLAGFKGLIFHANAFQIHGTGLSATHVGSMMPVSYIEALETTRLLELWLEQKFARDTFSLRLGQLAADSEFNISSYAGQFINGSFGWPASLAAALPSGGPAYPLATPGVRGKWEPNKNVAVLLGVYNGDPAGPGAGDPQLRNRYGLNFRMHDSPLVISEMQLRANQDQGAAGLASSLKVGAWRHFGSFADLRYGSDGLSLVDPAGNGLPAGRNGDHGIYGVVDQQIWRPASGEPDKGIGVFGRAGGTPSDRNLIDLYLDGGIVFAGLIPSRPDDIVSFGAAYARISSGVRGLDLDVRSFSGGGLVRTSERLLEINYQAQVAPGWQVDLDVQRVFNPGGNIANPISPNGAAIADATVATVHTLIKY